ncbi:unnamed protein product, partial [Closterium sp. Naga37s-1]
LRLLELRNGRNRNGQTGNGTEKKGLGGMSRWIRVRGSVVRTHIYLTRLALTALLRIDAMFVILTRSLCNPRLAEGVGASGEVRNTIGGSPERAMAGASATIRARGGEAGRAGAIDRSGAVIGCGSVACGDGRATSHHSIPPSHASLHQSWGRPMALPHEYARTSSSAHPVKRAPHQARTSSSAHLRLLQWRSRGCRRGWRNGVGRTQAT